MTGNLFFAGYVFYGFFGFFTGKVKACCAENSPSGSEGGPL